MRTLFTAFLVCWSITLFGDLPEGDYVVVFQGRESPREVARDHGVGIKRGWTNAVHGFSAHLNANQATKLERDTRVQIIEPDLTVTALAQATPTGVRRVGCQNNTAWNNSSITPINSDIAILDTGIDLTHPDLNVYASTNFTTSTTANDLYGHGSHCAGIAAARNNTIGVSGVAPGARLWSVKVLDDTGSGSLSTIISGVDYVTQHATEIEVASMSLGGQGAGSSLRTAIQECVAKGVIVVVASGNSGFEIYGQDGTLGTSDDFFPACYPEVMTVSALADSDGAAGGYGIATGYGLDDTLATFSNFSTSVVADNPVYSPGAAIDLAAPGVDIYSTYKNGTYATLSGTSMACPHVAGAVALYCSIYGRANDAAGVYAIRQRLIDLAEPQSSWGVNPPNPYYIDHNPEGLLDVRQIGQTYTPGTPPTVRIISPLANAVYTNGATVTFTGTATNSGGTSVSSGLIWASSLQGNLGTGASFTHSLTNGSHTITAHVTDASVVGWSSVKIIVTTPGNSRPSVTITAPTNNTVFPNGTLITMSGTARDSEDGVISGNILWQRNGSRIGVGASMNWYPAPGMQVVNSIITDSGLMSDTNTVTFYMSDDPTPMTNHSPVVSISYPVDGASFAEGAGVTVSSTAADAEDGTLTSSITLNDSLNGFVGTGGSVLYFPNVGSHVLTATVSDSSGLIGTCTRSFTVYARQVNTPPSISITAPTNGITVISNTAVTLSATATDTEDGTLVPSWYNSLSGVLGSGASLITTLTNVGTNLITGSATDSGGLVAQAQVSVIVTNAVVVTNAYPVVLLTVPTNGLTVTTGTTVLYAGSATDAEDGALVVTWVDSIAGLLGTGNTGAYIPAIGTHTLTASGTDSQGATSSKSVLVQVNNTNALPSQLTVALVTDRTTYVNKQKAKITATVTCNGAAVVGATCNFTIRGASGGTQSKTVTTTTGGVASFYVPINKAKLGAGVATVTVNASKSGYYSATKSTTFTIL